MRELKPSLFRMLATWRSLVFSLMTSAAEISRFDLDWTMSAAQPKAILGSISERASKGSAG